MDRTVDPGTVSSVLSFADGDLASPALLGALEDIVDRFMDDDAGWHDDLVSLLCDHPTAELFFTLRPLCASLFSRFGADDPDTTAAELAELVRPVVAGVWGMTVDEPRYRALAALAPLIASDFSSENPGDWSETERLRTGELLTALVQWVIAMSVTLSYLDDAGCSGGTPIGWFSRPNEAPDVRDRVIVGGAAS